MDGTLTAIAINIFPPELRARIRQVQFVMDTGNIMTNAVVFQNVRRIEGRTLYLRLGDSSAVNPGPARDRGTMAADGTLAATAVTTDQPTR